MAQDLADGDPLRGLLDPDEHVEDRAHLRDAEIALSDRRLAVVQGKHVALAVEISHVRRMEFDLEKGLPATVTIVPDSPLETPQALWVEADDYDEVAALLVKVGRRLDAESDGPAE